MRDFTEFVTQYHSLDDSTRSQALRELEEIWQETPCRHRGQFVSSMPLAGRPLPLSCTAVRRITRPFPKSLQEYSPADRLREAEKHVLECPQCRFWHEIGRPYVFDMAWDTDRRAFCSCIQIALRYEKNWPLSYEIAAQHADRCESCGEWHIHLHASHDCGATRGLLKKGETRLAYMTFDLPANATDNHVERCEECQRWCEENVTCEEVREQIDYVVWSNDSDWKSYRHDTLGPMERYHLNRCKVCREWLISNIKDCHASGPVFRILANLGADEETNEMARNQQKMIKNLLMEALAADKGTDSE